ncbi:MULTISPECIES: hypothetical protein [Microbacterium]|uniref:Uncharacterized protein n=1 Tax=Microbacterium wangchenii TaxID=2541726 RepID=A0ABX5SXK1_9MICO|nr:MULTISPECIES: hypothetical protein [Microbacterium]MCK6067530.1 hypothetical protein [Microbacterium sp. EYE_512]QBR89540.1 hypothetical protein E4K62_13155 [Microbacterium wangchenii]TXK16862.1 hypothetical protein FVP99_09360 [Microbacterium wangchenii]
MTSRTSKLFGMAVAGSGSSILPGALVLRLMIWDTADWALTSLALAGTDVLTFLVVLVSARAIHTRGVAHLE